MAVIIYKSLETMFRDVPKYNLVIKIYIFVGNKMSNSPSHTGPRARQLVCIAHGYGAAAVTNQRY